MKRSFSIWAVFFFALVGTGCGQNSGDEPTKYQSQAGLEKLTAQAQNKATADNPKFSSVNNIVPGTTTSKDIDSIIRPVLAKTFKDARLSSANGPEAPQRDGEIIEDRLIYSVKAVLTEPDGDKLHSAFRSAGFVTSPRLGSKPTHSRGNVYMSLMRSTSQRGYSFVIIVYTGRQRIEVESYRLGSKYDRLM
jgi:hypothetical protein